MHSKSIQSPSKKKIKESVPFMNGSYDFSTVGSGGEITYNEREITIILGLPAYNKEQLQTLYSKVLEWLVDIGQNRLIFDDIMDYYYMAEVENTSTLEQVMSFGQMTVTFVAEPFKKSVEYVGSDIWDVFNFEEDYFQSVDFNVQEYKEVKIYNPGRAAVPIIECNANMTVTLNDYTAELIDGVNEYWSFRLQPGTNHISIEGTGHIKFIFRKERL